jgi:CPA1 family monovalent cation:H+ antiporter
MLYSLEVILGVLVAVAVLALVARKLPIPYPILLVLGGLGLALVPGVPPIGLNPELVFLVLLPPLLYPAALFTHGAIFTRICDLSCCWRSGWFCLRRLRWGSWHIYYIEDLPLAAGFVLGAIISPPDAIAATAITERLRVPRRIISILEGESW